MSQFRKKPVVIEAVQFDGTREGVDVVAQFMNVRIDPYFAASKQWAFSIGTLEGPLNASAGDWIIRGVKGEFYPCKPDIFAATYEPVAASETPAKETSNG